MLVILLRTLLIVLLGPVTFALAQDRPPASAVAPPENPLSAHNKAVYGGMKKILLRSAEVMPEESYNFKSTEAVRSFGQIVGHIADSQYFMCSSVLGKVNPGLKIEETKTSKADLIAALSDAFAYCDEAYNGMTDGSGTQRVKFMGSDTPKLGALNINNVHTALHYGNLITYMRMKNIVPPSSEPEFMKQLRR
jgi:uncharacterized damage-inducible protein DinB